MFALSELKAKLKGTVKKALPRQLFAHSESTAVAEVEEPVAEVEEPVAEVEETLAEVEKPPLQLDRKTVANYYLKGQGIEVGALHNPLQTPEVAHVQYVDRLTVDELRSHYPELAEVPLVEIDIVDDGERLNSIPDASQDFVVANHFIEHCQDPIRTLQMMLRVLKPGGILYLGIPDKRYTFDKDRPVTTTDHLLQDYYEGPGQSKRQHFQEFSKFCWLGYTNDSEDIDDAKIEEAADRFIEQDYSIHFHVWTQTEILELLVTLKKTLDFGFEVELFLKKQDEMILILRKDDLTQSATSLECL